MPLSPNVKTSTRLQICALARITTHTKTKVPGHLLSGTPPFVFRAQDIYRSGPPAQSSFQPPASTAVSESLEVAPTSAPLLLSWPPCTSPATLHLHIQVPIWLPELPASNPPPAPHIYPAAPGPRFQHFFVVSILFLDPPIVCPLPFARRTFHLPSNSSRVPSVYAHDPPQEHFRVTPAVFAPSYRIRLAIPLEQC